MFKPLNILANRIIYRKPYAWNYFFTSAINNLKIIKENKEGNILTIEAEIVPSPREPLMITQHNKGACSICSLNLDVKHTDVLILNQFLRSDGCMLPRRVTNLCRKQQKRITTLVAMAQKAGLMSHIAPANSKKDPSLRPTWKKYNTYFDESTIRVRW